VRGGGERGALRATTIGAKIKEEWWVSMWSRVDHVYRRRKMSLEDASKKKKRKEGLRRSERKGYGIERGRMRFLYFLSHDDCTGKSKWMEKLRFC